MYIHSYQINNVLNVYRKQLSHAPGGNSSKEAPVARPKDRITISTGGQRQSIMDKISSEIVERIVQTEPNTQFESVMADELSKEQTHQFDPDSQSSFKYTVIDEHNRKLTNTLTIQGFGKNTDEMD